MTSCDGGSTNCHFTCPHGGSWFVCPDKPYFVGCCSSDPCTSTNTTSPCPDLYPASFNSSIEREIAPNDCISAPSDDWYTCNFTSPPFVGCCKSNPCGTDDGCPTQDLLPAAWSSTAVGQLKLFLDGASSPSTASTSATSSAKLSSGAIAGIVVGGVVALCVIFAVVFFLRRQWQRRQPSTDSTAYHRPSSSYHEPHMESPNPDHDHHKSKHESGSAAGFTISTSSPISPSSPRPTSEIYSPSDYHFRANRYTSIETTPTASQVIAELDSREFEIHELDGTK